MSSLRYGEDINDDVTGRTIDATSKNRQEVYLVIHYNHRDLKTIDKKILLSQLIVERVRILIKILELRFLSFSQYSLVRFKQIFFIVNIHFA